MNIQRGILVWMSGQKWAENGWKDERQVRVKTVFGSCTWQFNVNSLLYPFKRADSLRPALHTPGIRLILLHNYWANPIWRRGRLLGAFKTSSPGGLKVSYYYTHKPSYRLIHSHSVFLMSAGAPDLLAHGAKSGITSDIDNGVIQVFSQMPHTWKLDGLFLFLFF